MISLPTSYLRTLCLGLLSLMLSNLGMMAQEAGEVLTLRYAKNFKIEYLEGAKLITVTNPWRGGDDVRLRYLLVKKDTDISTLPKDVTRITIPCKRIVIGSTTYLPHMVALGIDERIIGVTDPQLVNTSEIRERIDSGDILKVGHSATLNREIIINAMPDLVISSAIGDPGRDTHQQLARSNIPVVLTADYMESSALARAEWIKFIAAFFDEETQADALFNEIEARYLALKQLTQGIEKRPTVFCNIPWSGTWYTPGGGSYQASLINDAGGDYIWSQDDTSGSLPLDFESVYARALDADFWLHTRNHNTLKSLISADARYATFKAVKTAHAYNNNAILNQYGGNGIWERGTLYPHEVLADLIHILHPQLLPEHTLTFYRKLD